MLSAVPHKPAQCSIYNDLTEQHSLALQMVLEVSMLCCMFGFFFSSLFSVKMQIESQSTNVWKAFLTCCQTLVKQGQRAGFNRCVCTAWVRVPRRVNDQQDMVLKFVHEVFGFFTVVFQKRASYSIVSLS